MNYPTSDFLNLKASLSRARILVDPVPDTVDLTDEDEFRVRSYIVLTHAAIEEYLENLSLTVAGDSLEAYHNDSRIYAPLLAMVFWYKFNEKNDNKNGNLASDFKNLVKRAADFASNQHIEKIIDNHGIKEKNQHVLFWPLGIEISDVDAQLSGALESFGEKRGPLAHSIGAKFTHTKSSAVNEVATLETLLGFLDKAAFEASQKLIHSL